MSNIVPFNQKSQVPQTTFGNMLEDFFSDPWFPFRQSDMETFKLDVKEDKDNYTIEAEVPGVKKEDITLDFDEGRLTIGIAAREITDEDEKKLVHKERRYSYMERTIYLADADDQGAQAKLDKGELTITVPKKKKEAKTKNIEVQQAAK